MKNFVILTLVLFSLTAQAQPKVDFGGELFGSVAATADNPTGVYFFRLEDNLDVVCTIAINEKIKKAGVLCLPHEDMGNFIKNIKK